MIDRKRLEDFAGTLRGLASTDIQMNVEPYARLDWHTLRSVATMVERLALGVEPRLIAAEWVADYTWDDEVTGEADYEVIVTLPGDFDRGPNGMIKDAIWQRLALSGGLSSGYGDAGEYFGVGVRVPAGTSMYDVRAKAVLITIVAAHEAGHPFTTLPFADEAHPMG